jgi:hypothetical protein
MAFLSKATGFGGFAAWTRLYTFCGFLTINPLHGYLSLGTDARKTVYKGGIPLQEEPCNMEMDIEFATPPPAAQSANWSNADSLLLVKAFSEIEKTKERTSIFFLSCLNY